MPMKLFIFFLLFTFYFLAPKEAEAQCSICTKTAQQLGEKPAKALNGAIIYLAFVPLALMGYIGYRWYNSNREA